MARVKRKHIVIDGEIVSFDKTIKEGQLCYVANVTFRDLDGVTLFFERLILPESMALSFNIHDNLRCKFYLLRLKTKKSMSAIFYAAENKDGQLFYYKEDAEKILKTTARLTKYPIVSQIMSNPPSAGPFVVFSYFFWIVSIWILLAIFEPSIFKKLNIGSFNASLGLAILPAFYFASRPFLFFRWRGEALYSDMKANLKKGGFSVAAPADLNQQLPDKY